MNSKKAVSPLIATILLIVVAVILVAVVLTWGRDFATDALADADGMAGGACNEAIGTLAIDSCSVDGNVLSMILRNRSGSYVHSTGFDADLSSGNDLISVTDLNSGGSALELLNPGQSAAISIENENITENEYEVRVKAQDCPSDGYVVKTCS